MEQEYSTKAIFIALSLFVVMLVITLIINYYTAAKEISKQAQLKMDIPETFDAIMKNHDQVEDKISGAELQSLIRKYAYDDKVTINIVSISNNDSPENQKARIDEAWFDDDIGIIDEKELSTINPSWVVLVEKVINGEYTTLNVHLDYTIDSL
ncbi:MAG: hypothetical protein IKK84_03515 [Clostridia bacterium]|nr:hypothetical protein [Clostridia bacterium]MBR6641674.1 hypothetical protein [Clostridia bacterium]